MLITFANGVSADVVMFGNAAMKLIHMMGRPQSLPGVIQPADIPAALKLLRAGLQSDAQAAPPVDANDADADDWDEAAVSLAHRALPLVELLERAQAADTAVLWSAGGQGF